MADVNSGHSTSKSCPSCGKLAVAKADPFCSERCRNVDLNRWLNGSYAIPAEDDDRPQMADDD